MLTVTHEMRSPLSAIKDYAARLADLMMLRMKANGMPT